MRNAVLVAVTLLVAGCSQTGGDHAGPSQTSSAASSTVTKIPSQANPPSAAVPAAGAPVAAVIAWIEAGRPAEATGYKIGADTAFSASGGKAKCTTDAKHTAGLLSCLVELTNPPPRPETAYGEWKGGWVDFDGSHLQVGSARADPGPFLNGTGAELANGASVAFDDFRCRADQVGLFCVNYAHQSAARFSAAGIEPFGCLSSVPAPEGVGVAFNCP